MGHLKLNLAILAAGAFTLGAAVGIGPTAEASPLVLNEVVVQGGLLDACVTFEMHEGEMVYCTDPVVEGWYDEEHYAVEADTDGEGFYLVVWR